MAKFDLTAQRLRELLDYDPETGKLTRIGSDADVGTITRGYIRLWAGGVRLYAHRAAWAIYYGAIPKGEIDHINGDRADNRIVNLRDVEPTLNRANLQTATVRNVLGILGVRYIQRIGKYEARIRVDGRQIVLGYFPELEDARATVDSERAARFR